MASLSMKDIASLLARIDKVEANNRTLRNRLEVLENRFEIAPPAKNRIKGTKDIIEHTCPTCKAQPFEPCVTASGSKPGTVTGYNHGPRADLWLEARRKKRL